MLLTRCSALANNNYNNSNSDSDSDSDSDMSSSPLTGTGTNTGTGTIKINSIIEGRDNIKDFALLQLDDLDNNIQSRRNR